MNHNVPVVNNSVNPIDFRLDEPCKTWISDPGASNVVNLYKSVMSEFQLNSSNH